MASYLFFLSFFLVLQRPLWLGYMLGILYCETITMQFSLHCVLPHLTLFSLVLT